MHPKTQQSKQDKWTHFNSLVDAHIKPQASMVLDSIDSIPTLNNIHDFVDWPTAFDLRQYLPFYSSWICYMMDMLYDGEAHCQRKWSKCTLHIWLSCCMNENPQSARFTWRHIIFNCFCFSDYWEWMSLTKYCARVILSIFHCHCNKIKELEGRSVSQWCEKLLKSYVNLRFS